MAAIIAEDRVVWGLQLPIQAQSTNFVQPWEIDCGAGELADVARAADEAGAFYLGVCDHIGIPRPADEEMSATWYEPMTTLGWISGFTSRVNLLSHVYVLAYRHPMVTAKAFCTLDDLSDGRAILGAGAGHLESEFQMLGLDFASRGRAVEQAVPVIRSVFMESYPVLEFDGAAHEVAVSPRPTRSGGPPIWLGGSSRAAIRRAALLGDGWLPQGPPSMGTRAAIVLIAEERDRAGLPAAFDLGVNCEPVHLGAHRDNMADSTLCGPAEQVAERLNRYPVLGINQLQVRFVADSAQEYCEQVRAFGEEVAPLLGS